MLHGSTIPLPEKLSVRLTDASTDSSRCRVSGLVAVCGSISADMFGYAPRLPKPGESVLGDRFLLAPGGKGANVAVAAARLGVRVRFFGARGDDQFGDFIGGALGRTRASTSRRSP